MQGYGQASVQATRLPREAHPDYGPPGQDAMCSKQPAVSVALGRLTENITNVSQALEALEARLLPVLRNEPEPPMKEEMCDGVVPLSQTITGSVLSLAKIRDRISSILNRLEL